MTFELSSVGSILSIATLPIAFGIAVAYVLLKPRKHGHTRFRAAVRYLLSTRIWLHPSTLLDMQYILVGALGFSAIFSYSLLNGYVITAAVNEAFTHWFGPQSPRELPWFAMVFAVCGLHLAFELGYWLDHFLKHKVAFLWEFHKVHHSATVLTPFANWRVHPVDTMIYLNILAVVVGAAGGLVLYFAGEEFWFTSVTISGILYAGYLAIWGHLQHSQLWISWTGLPGRLVLSPAHHQIHHSNNPIHFDKNFGAGLAIWDWMFGTLHVPQKKDEHLHYGTHNDAHLQRLVPSVLYPLFYSAKRLLGIFWSNNSTPPVAEREPASQPEVSIPDREDAKELTYEYDRRG